MNRYILNAVLFSALLAQSLPSAVFAQNKDVVISVSVRNGTAEIDQFADAASLVLMKSQPEIIQDLKNPGAKFQFSPIPKPAFPLAIRIQYKNRTFSRMLWQEDINSPAPKIVRVYEDGALAEQILITSMLYIIRKKTFLQVTEFFSIQNQSHPPRVYSHENLILSLPENARSVKMMAQHGATGMTEPVRFDSIDGMTGIQHDFQPGNSELSIEYTIPADSFTAGSLHHLNSGSTSKKEDIKILLWQPPEAVLEVQGGKTSLDTIPDYGEVLTVRFLPGNKLTYFFSEGGYVVDSLESAWRNPFFDSIHKTLLGILLVFLILLAALYYSVRSKNFQEK